MIDFSGKTVLVTGGARGVGRAIARRFVRLGATVVLNYFHSVEAARETERELTQMGGTVHLLRASVAKRDQVDRMFDALGELTDGLDVLVNNAASGALLPMAELTDRHWERAWQTNVKGSAWCAERAAPLIAARGGGSIVNLSSLGSDLVIGNYVSVGTSKAAVESLTRYLAVEYAPMNIRVNTASCGLVQGEVLDLFPQAEDFRDVVVDATPMGRLATEDELASIVVFLASEAASWVTGQTLIADGGLSLANAILSPPKRPVTVPGEPAPPRPAPASEERGEPGARAELPQPVAAEAREPLSSQPGESHDDDIVVVGMGLRCPGARDPEEFWRLRVEGGVWFSEPGERWDLDSFFSADPAAPDRTYSRKAGYIHEQAGDEEYTVTWLRQVLGQALDGVGRAEGDRFACYVGYTADGTQHLEEHLVAAGVRRHVPDREVAKAMRASLPRAGAPAWTHLPHVIGRRFTEGLLPADTRVVMLDTACSSSLYAVDLGIKDLLAGDADVAVCGGAYALGPRNPVMFAKINGLSRTDQVRAFDQAGDGVLFADGAGIVVLKKAGRAKADGDRILGVIRGLGTSSDGKGKAIYAPNSEGQRLAIERALHASGVRPDDIDWIAAHATGTPAGDLTEFSTLQQVEGRTRPWYVTSSKSQIGHTGWAAGVVSLIEVLLAFAHERIPPQHQFERLSPEIDRTGGTLVVPKEPLPWPRSARPRLAGVSGFGFGGTNAHVIVADRSGGAGGGGDGADRAAERVAVVGWTAHVPGLTSQEEVTAWLRGEGRAPGLSFGEQYPLPSLKEVRIPPKTLRNADRAQLMVLECALRLRPSLERTWTGLRDTTGVIVGHMGPTRQAAAYSLRCYLPYLEGAARADGRLAGRAGAEQALAGLRAAVDGTSAPASEDSLPGVMPNIIPARVANYLDFRGVNLTVDTGLSSSLEAVRTAMSYLRHGDLDLALVCGVNGNSALEMADILSAEQWRGGDLAEGAFMVALTRESTARAEGLPVLAYLDDETDGAGEARRLQPDWRRGRSYLGGEMARALIEALVSDSARTDVTCRDPFTTREDRLIVDRPPAGEPPSAAVERYVVRLREQDGLRVGEPFPVTAATVILTGDDDVAEALAGRGRVVRPDTVLGSGGADLSFDTLLVVARAGGETAEEEILRLHDAVFTLLRAGRDRLTRCHIVLLDAVRDGVPHAYVGLFTGLAKSAGWEIPGCATGVSVVAGHDVDAALRTAWAQARHDEPVPVLVHDGATALAPVARPEPAPDRGRLPLGESSVVLATGGARGITAEILVALARETKAQIWVIGRNPLDEMPTWVSEGDDAEFARRRTDFWRQERHADPGCPPSELKRRADRLTEAREARRNLARMSEHSGEERVRYLACDVRDAGAVAAAVDAVVAAAGRIDLVVHGAGVNHAAALEGKRLEDFQRVRDVKVRGYLNLKRALAGRAPAHWCNFGSVIGFAGQPGELDYAAGNDFLAWAAHHARTTEGIGEFTVAWTLWNSVGFAADELTSRFLRRHGALSGMEIEEGVARFLDELRAAPGDPVVVHLEPGQRDLLRRHRPALLAAATGGSAGSPVARTSRTEDLTLDADPCLAGHTVKGRATVPGAFLAEAAARAAAALVPGTAVAALSGTVFSSFVRGRPSSAEPPYRVVAEALPGTAAETRVRVRILSDMRAPNGMLLRRDHTHFETTVHLADRRTAPPLGETTGDGGWRALPDPYTIPNDMIHLSGLFDVNRECRVREGESAARFRLPDAARPAGFGDFLLPVLLLDGLFRVAALHLAGEDEAALVVPARVDRIEFYDPGNDLALEADHPDGIELRGLASAAGDGSRTPAGRLVAHAGDGTVLLTVLGLHGAVRGRVRLPALAART
ncbi:SDR family oxidoreductase [Microbispora sp. KK1-11]|uniref:SDR family oxidoreductase n=1 Tax=Microbispora sp. KK1-11 TaxID=2053005 RepID=UPI00115928EB|nr:SDR family oxidoreductase [Microbispora sp. KK1-11]TQS28844.1 SDR family oxidoreductase [Microbispora sp. KK1-11]